MENNELYYPQILFKKNRKLKFQKTHKPINHGPNYIFDKEENCLNHYKWVKRTKRMLIRHRTSGFYPNMLEWFKNNWNQIELIENKSFNYCGIKCYLERYNGSHPERLKDHPWRNIDDVRKLT